MYVCVHLFAGAPGSGKTAIAAHMAKQSDFPFLKICAPKSMIGYHEAAKVQAIKKVNANAMLFHFFSCCLVFVDILSFSGIICSFLSLFVALGIK